MPNERILEREDVREALDRRQDPDPNKWRPKFYAVDLECGPEINDTASSSVTLDNIPFVLDIVTHGILENTLDATLAAVYYQDGQYLLNWRDDHTNYQNVPIQADLMFGSIRSGFVIPLRTRIIYPGSKSLVVNIQNLVDRTAPSADPFMVQVVFHGFERWRR